MAVERALGCLYGQFIGDALGSRYEFKRAPVVQAMIEADRLPSGFLPLLGDGPFGYGPGVVTDDGEMAQSLLSSLIRMTSMDGGHVAVSYKRWSLTRPPDIGNTCQAALNGIPEELKQREALERKDWHSLLSSQDRDAIKKEIQSRVKKYNAESLSNGSLMRQSVMAAFFGPSIDSALSAVREDTSFTHSHPDALAASLLYTRALHALIQGKSPMEVHQDCLSSTESALLRTILSNSSSCATPVALPSGGCSMGDDKAIGYLGVAVQSAFYELLHATTFVEGVERAVGRGGDTDTNGAIVAAMLGARFGLEAIPKQWRETVEKAPMRMEGENGIESFAFLVKGISDRYE